MTSWPSARSLTAAVNSLTTSRLTSASSSARRISRMAFEIVSSSSFPRERRPPRIDCSLSPRASNIAGTVYGGLFRVWFAVRADEGTREVGADRTAAGLRASPPRRSASRAARARPRSAARCRPSPCRPASSGRRRSRRRPRRRAAPAGGRSGRSSRRGRAASRAARPSRRPAITRRTLRELLHQVRLRVQAAGGVDEDDVAAAALRGVDRVEGDGGGVGALRRADEVRAGALAPRSRAARRPRRGTCRRRRRAPSGRARTSRWASLPIVVVLPVPLTPTTRTTLGRSLSASVPGSPSSAVISVDERVARDRRRRGACAAARPARPSRPCPRRRRSAPPRAPPRTRRRAGRTSRAAGG